MFNSVNEVQRRYTYAVQPVKLFETRNQKPDENAFSFISKMKVSGNNPFHPDVSYTSKGKKLDIMG